MSSSDKHGFEYKNACNLHSLDHYLTILVCVCVFALYLQWDRRLNVFSACQQTSKHNSADEPFFH